MTKAEILEWLKKENKLAPFDNIEKSGEIDGCEVYGFTAKSGETLYVGLPSFIVVKDGEPRIIHGEEAFKIIDALKNTGKNNQ